MAIEWAQQEVKQAIRHFWKVRDGGKGVLGGKTLDPFLKIIERVVHEAGLTEATIHTGKNTSQLPGFFRPHKAWDAVVINKNKLVAAMELKSQVGSIGNNFNNRSEEVLGSSLDLKTAVEESAFGDDANVFTGYLIVVEKSAQSEKYPKIEMKYFSVMEGFLQNENDRGIKYRANENGEYPQTLGISYLERYDLLCKRLMTKNLYTAAALIAAPNRNHDEGLYEHLSPNTSVETLLLRLSNHCQVVAEIESQRT